MTIKRRFLLMNENPEQQQQFAWLPEWISPYESPWSIFEKFKYANRATVKDLFDLFGTSYTKSLKSKHLSQKACNLLTLEGLDESLLKLAFGLSLKEVNRRNINMLTNILPGDQHYFFHKLLKLCPECIKIGYHSIFHQFSLIHRCPFHNVSLVEGCPKCKRKMSYHLSDKDTMEPFRCKCGHLLFSLKNGQRYPSSWEKMNLQNQSKPLKYWITFNLENVHEKIFLYFQPDLDLQKNEGVMEFILEAISPSYKTNQSDLHREVKSSPYIRNFQKQEKTKSFLLTDECEFELKKAIYQSSTATIRSIVSNIRKKFFDHSNCIRNFHNNHYKPIKNCPYAFAFVFWRTFNEGDDSIYDGNRRRKDIPFFNSLEYHFATKQDHNYLNNLLFRVRTHCHIDNLAAIKWILNRVMSHLTLNHLKNWLKIASLNAHKSMKFLTVPFNFEHLPFYLVIIPKNLNEPFEFHWWPRKDALQLDNLDQTSLKCPLNKEETR
ncbi:hypothetical protein SOP93_22125 [Peribacillus frigoritolerans]|uniref:hypothetical protein n=1 Tax=Peribacillus frigoritolerans TaxID=450367 RepID=UPI002B23F8CB|nr:hypothetical protein [Peribacillus frigoritolerans]MEB2493832.1 hypothetical protein [Peribacillus frigoritolerans]